MKTFNITAQVIDTIKHPSQMLLINDVIKAKDKILAENIFITEALVDDIRVIKILSIEEISQVVA